LALCICTSFVECEDPTSEPLSANLVCVERHVAVNVSMLAARPQGVALLTEADRMRLQGYEGPEYEYDEKSEYDEVERVLLELPTLQKNLAKLERQALARSTTATTTTRPIPLQTPGTTPRMAPAIAIATPEQGCTPDELAHAAKAWALKTSLDHHCRKRVNVNASLGAWQDKVRAKEKAAQAVPGIRMASKPKIT
jgi:hypothetical protein